MPTIYEYVVETLDFYEGCKDNPDIIDTSGFDKLADAEDFARGCSESWRIALRRDTGDDDEGITDRWYAYPDVNGRLPSHFTDGVCEGPSVPKRFLSISILVDTRSSH